MSILDAVMQVGGPPAVLLHPEAAAASTPTHAARRQPPARASGASGFVRPGRQWPEAGPLASERHRIGGVGFSATPPGVCSCSPSRRDTPQAAWQRTGVRRCRAAPAGSHLPGRGRTGVEGRRVPPHAVLTLSRGASWRFKGPRQCRLGRGAWGTTRGPEAVFDAPVGGPRAVGCSAWGASGRTMEREALKPAPGYALSSSTSWIERRPEPADGCAIMVRPDAIHEPFLRCKKCKDVQGAGPVAVGGGSGAAFGCRQGTTPSAVPSVDRAARGIRGTGVQEREVQLGVVAVNRHPVLVREVPNSGLGKLIGFASASATSAASRSIASPTGFPR